VEPDTKTETATLTFNTFTPVPTINFAPIETLPAEVTYTLTDDQGNTWDSMTGYNVSVDPYPINTPVDFTQIYKNGNTVLATQTIRAGVGATFGGKRFSGIIIDGSATTVITPVELSFEAVVAEFGGVLNQMRG